MGNGGLPFLFRSCQRLQGGGSATPYLNSRRMKRNRTIRGLSRKGRSGGGEGGQRDWGKRRGDPVESQARKSL